MNIVLCSCSLLSQLTMCIKTVFKFRKNGFSLDIQIKILRGQIRIHMKEYQRSMKVDKHYIRDLHNLEILQSNV